MSQQTSVIPQATAQKIFYIGDPAGRDVVRFTSDAPLELIQGMTNKIQGKVAYDNGHFKFDPQHPFQIEFDVDLGSLDTGIPMRNEHMRDNYLNTAQYPKATFKVTRVDTQVRPPFKPGQVVPVLAKGELTVHGKTVPKVVPIKVTYWPESPVTQKRFKAGNLIRIQGAFPVSLKEHGIPVPEIANQKLAQTIQVSVDAFGTDNPAALK